jgi:hypothetical protein
MFITTNNRFTPPAIQSQATSFQRDGQRLTLKEMGDVIQTLNLALTRLYETASNEKLLSAIEEAKQTRETEPSFLNKAQHLYQILGRSGTVRGIKATFESIEDNFRAQYAQIMERIHTEQNSMPANNRDQDYLAQLAQWRTRLTDLEGKVSEASVDFRRQVGPYKSNS